MGEQGQQEVQGVKIRLTPVSILKYLSYAAALIGLLSAIFLTLAVDDGTPKAASFFAELLSTVFFSGVLYGLSCLVALLSKKE